MAKKFFKNWNNGAPRQSAADKHKNPDYGKIDITVQSYNKSLKVPEANKTINFYNVDDASAQEIVARLTDKTKPRLTNNAYIDKFEPTHLLVNVLAKNMEDWLDDKGGDLNAIKSVLIKSGQYDTEEIMHLEDDIATKANVLSKEDAKQLQIKANDTAMDMWREYLSKISDPATVERLKLYARIYGHVTYGHILSIKNATLIKSYDPDATFVLTRNMWRSLFGRGIKRGAKKIPYIAPYGNNAGDAASFQNAKNNYGWGHKADKDLSQQVRYDLRIKASDADSDGFNVVIGYDVRDTYLLSGAKDTFNAQDEIGLLNNLNGELNQAAKQDQAERNKNTDKENIAGADLMLKRTDIAVTWMENYCRDNQYPVSVRPNEDASEKLADMLLEYYKINVAKKGNILTPNNIRTYAENATQVTLILTNLGLPALRRFNLKYNYSKPEAITLMGIVWGIAGDLDKASVLNEGILSWIKSKVQFFKLFIKALRKIGCTVSNSNVPVQQNGNNNAENAEVEPQALEEARQTFNNIWNKINKNYF